MKKSKKKSKKKGGIGEVFEIVNFIKDRMMTASDGKEMEKRLSDRIDKVGDRTTAVEGKIKGIYNLLEEKARTETDLKIPSRLHDVEEKVYGVGGSKHPKHISL